MSKNQHYFKLKVNASVLDKDNEKIASFLPSQWLLVKGSFMNRSEAKALMHDIGCGEIRALKCLMDRYLDIVARTAFRILCDRKDCEAVTRDVFVHVWNYSEKYDGAISLKMWILRLTCRYARRQLVIRRLMYIFGHRPDLFVTSSPKAPDYDDYVTKQAWELYCRASVHLSFRQRELFTLCVLEDISPEDVSLITRISVRGIRRLLADSESTFRRELRYYGKADEYDRYVGFLRIVEEGFVEHDKLKRIILASIS